MCKTVGGGNIRDKRPFVQPFTSGIMLAYEPGECSLLHLSKYRTSPPIDLTPTLPTYDMEKLYTQGAYKPRREKLRSSCDGCASSKVRCEKQQPSCSRCKQLDQACIYGRSRRRGKPVSKLSPPTTTPVPEKSAWDYTEALHTSIDSTSWQFSNLHDDFIPGQRWPESDPCPTAETLDGSDLHFMAPLTGDASKVASRWTENNEQLMLSSRPTDLIPLASSSSPYSTRPEPSNAPFEEDMSELGTWLSTADHGGNSSCISTALTTLTSLYRLACGSSDTRISISSSIESGTSTPELSSGLSSNHALLIAREATQKLDQLLACTCTSCMHEPNMFFILANIAAKVLSWYRSLYNANIRSFYACASAVNSQSSLPKPILTHVEDALVTMPLTIGTFHLPPATELRIRAQLLLCELQPLAQACNTLGTRSRRKEGHGEEPVFEALKVFLQRGVKDLSRSLEALCGQLD